MIDVQRLKIKLYLDFHYKLTSLYIKLGYKMDVASEKAFDKIESLFNDVNIKIATPYYNQQTTPGAMPGL